MASKKAFRWAALLAAAAAALTLGGIAAPAGAIATTPATAPTSAPDVPAVAAPAFPGRLYGVTAIARQRRLGGRARQRRHARAALQRQQVDPVPRRHQERVLRRRRLDLRQQRLGGRRAPTGSPRRRPSPTTGTASRGAGSTPTPASGYFNAVAATSATNAWAVGLIGPETGVVPKTTPLIEHWNGKTLGRAELQGVRRRRSVLRSLGDLRDRTRGRSARPTPSSRRPADPDRALERQGWTRSQPERAPGAPPAP